jgi:hypothetical protein
VRLAKGPGRPGADAALAGEGLVRVGDDLVPRLGYLRVSDMLADVRAPAGTRPAEKALRDLRRRIGAAAVRALFESIAVPLA